MLVNCPRCGFSQPKDKYCAQCGVDTETFQRPRASAWQKTLASPVLFLGIAIIAAFLFFKTYYKQDTANLTQRVRFLKGSLQIANHSSNNSGETKPAEPEAASPTREIATVNPAPAAPPTADAGNSAAVTGTTTAAAPAPSSAIAPTTAASLLGPGTPAHGVVAGEEPSVTIYYAEVPRRAFEKIQEESQATGQFNSFGDYTAGILPDVQKRIYADALKIQIHEKSQERISKDRKWFTGIHDAELEEDVGLGTFIELSDTENNTFRGNIQIVRSWYESAENGNGGSVQKTSYPAIFELSPGAGFFIAGVLPRKAHVAHEARLPSKGAFQILKSTPFQNNESEFVIFIEFRKKP